MKYLKKKKRNPMILVVPILGVLVLLIVLIFVGKNLQTGNATDPTTNTQPQQTQNAVQPNPETTQATESLPEEDPAVSNSTGETLPEESEETDETDESTETEYEKPEAVAIDTPYATLYFPGEWSGFLQVSKQIGMPYTVTFYAQFESGKDQELFSIRFDDNEEGAVGILDHNGTDVAVHVESIDFKPDSDWSDREINVVFNMQEALNDMLVDMHLIEPQPSDQPDNSSLPEEDGEEMAIDTPYGELYFPARWKDYLKLEIDDSNEYSVTFICKVADYEDQALFTVYYDSSNGIEVGTVKDSAGENVQVSIDIVSIEPDSTWTDSYRRLVQAMQEDMNYLLAKIG